MCVGRRSGPVSLARRGDARRAIHDPHRHIRTVERAIIIVVAARDHEPRARREQAQHRQPDRDDGQRTTAPTGGPRSSRLRREHERDEIVLFIWLGFGPGCGRPPAPCRSCIRFRRLAARGTSSARRATDRAVGVVGAVLRIALWTPIGHRVPSPSTVLDVTGIPAGGVCERSPTAYTDRQVTPAQNLPAPAS